MLGIWCLRGWEGLQAHQLLGYSRDSLGILGGMGGQRQAVLDLFQGWGKEADWHLIKILIPTLPFFLPSQQPAFVCGSGDFAVMTYVVTSKTLANGPKTSICSPDALIRLGRMPPLACVFRGISSTTAIFLMGGGRWKSSWWKLNWLQVTKLFVHSRDLSKLFLFSR